jgi:tetratricopeptide (TPR) repeat protein
MSLESFKPSVEISRIWEAALDRVSRMCAVAMSPRGITVAALVGCAFLVIGPWLRSSISRDFRAIHIPWTDTATGSFLPEYVTEVPRAWHVASIATPLLATIAVGLVIAVWRPQWTNRAFGVLLALSIPALAATLWNHPGLVEFFEGEMRDRAMLRVMYRHRHEDTMTNRAPDRLRILGELNTREDVAAPTHPIAAPFRYSMFGPWLIVAAFAGVAIASKGAWTRRVAYASAYAGVGIILAAIITCPRWFAEYHFALAQAAEDANRFDDAQASLDNVLLAMPRISTTSRYWLAQGRLGYRQHKSNPYVTYFVASQYLNAGDMSRARNEIEHSIKATGGTPPERVLLAEIIGHIATEYGARAKYSAAEHAWGEAAAIVPWKPAYWLGEAVTILAADPSRAAEAREKVLPRVNQIGDCFVSSDFASMLGDAYFEAGEFHEAREMYSEAMRLFHLPKYVNLHAQEGRLGM